MPQKAFICSSGCNDVRPRQVLSFFCHRIKVKIAESYLPEQQYMFYFARVNWYSVHLERFSHGVPVEIWCNSFDLFGQACFMPVQRIKSNCSLGEKVYKQENVLGVTN